MSREVVRAPNPTRKAAGGGASLGRGFQLTTLGQGTAQHGFGSRNQRGSPCRPAETRFPSFKEVLQCKHERMAKTEAYIMDLIKEIPQISLNTSEVRLLNLPLHLSSALEDIGNAL
ncbi:hypothetical protein KI387_003721, partial [Taxus chinensis]